MRQPTVVAPMAPKPGGMLQGLSSGLQGSTAQSSSPAPVSVVQPGMGASRGFCANKLAARSPAL